MKSLLERLAEGEILMSDGAMGTFLHKKGLAPGECPESWCITHPAEVKDIAQSYVDAGSDLIESNSFGGSSLRLGMEHMAERAVEFNTAAAKIAKSAMGDKGYVAASVGPSGDFSIEEGGKVTSEQLYNSFKEQVIALAAGGADALCIETMSSLGEATQAIKAAKENTKLPIICTFSFEARKRGFFTMMGLTPEKAMKGAVAAGADIVGTNCGNGITNMIEIVKQMRAADTKTPILVHANAGMPKVVDGKDTFDETPEFMASLVPDLVAAGANILGGCCGTTPAHIAAMGKVARTLRAKKF